MNIQYEIHFYIKTPESKTLSIIVDGKPLKSIMVNIFGLIVVIGIGAGFSSLTIGVGLSGAIFSWFISALFIVIWIFFIYKLYRHSKGEF